MDSLANYASDGDNSNNSEDQKAQYSACGDTSRRASDVNYDPVQMDMSEESNNNNSSRESSSERTNSPLTTASTFNLRTETSRTLSSLSDQRRSDHENRTANSNEEHKRSDSRQTSEKRRRSSYDDRRQRGDGSHRDSRDLRRNRDDDNKPRDEDKRKEKSFGSSRDEKSEDRSEKSQSSSRVRREYNRDRNYRQHRPEFSSFRDRRHSRDVRPKDRHREDRSNYHKERDRTRSRSRSRDRAPPPFRTMSYREEKGRNKLAQLEKLGIELKAPEGDTSTPGLQGEQNYYNPLATSTQGKYAEQIQKRKLLWANKSKQEEGKGVSTAASTANTWVGTTFTHDEDGKLSAKFKRLMGIKDGLAAAPAQPTGAAKPDILKKQEEMFSNMEQQYEVARATTHTQRGVGLGYATGGYQFPR